MGRKISIQFAELTVEAELNDSAAVEAICQALPIEARVNTWGEEIYFDIGLTAELTAAAKSDMAVGELGYWPTGRAFCVFLGRTPASGADGAPRAASDVEPLGRVTGDVEPLKSVRDGQKVVLSANS